MTASVRLRLLVFALVGGLAVVVAGVRYAGLWSLVSAPSYSVRVEMPRSGGIFDRAEVTYRGVTVGRVGEVDFRRDGVVVTLDIDRRWKIPRDVRANVHDRSAVGEQYVDLVPQVTTGPVLHDGDVVTAAATSVPVTTAELLLALDRFVTSVPQKALRTTVDELSTAFDGTGDDFRRFITNARTILLEAQRSLPATKALLRDGGAVLQTQSDQAVVISSALRNLDALTLVLSDRTGDLRRILRDAVPAAQQLRAMFTGLTPVLPPLLGNIASLASVTTDRIAGLEEGLVTIPYALASAITPGRGERAHFAFEGTQDPKVCERGYTPPRRWRSPHDTSFKPMDDRFGCTQRGNTLPRGSNSELDRDPEGRHTRSSP
jgi:phospholipid/cholesterol/gamma-HCH transport system substrate-binding protein